MNISQRANENAPNRTIFTHELTLENLAFSLGRSYSLREMFLNFIQERIENENKGEKNFIHSLLPFL